MIVNYWAILLAAFASFVFGGLWYGVLSKPWMEAAGKAAQDIEGGGSMRVLFGVTIVCELVMAWVLAGLMLHLAKAGVVANVRNGLLTGAICWLGFVIPTMAVNHGYQGEKRALTLIDGGHWLGVLLLQGLVIGWLGLGQ